MSMQLSRKEIEEFQRDGFVGPIRAFQADEVEQLANEVSGILSGSEPTHHRHLDHPSVYRLCTPIEIIERISSLIGPDIMLWASNFFVKEPGSPGTPWHQDQNNGISPVVEPPLNISVWLAIDDVLSKNSCIKFLAGSHLQPVNHERPAEGQYFGLADTSGFDLSKATEMELRRGEFVIFTDRVLHGAEPNRSNLRRAGIAMRFTTPFVKILRDIKGQIVAGEDRFGFNQILQAPLEKQNIST